MNIDIIDYINFKFLYFIYIYELVFISLFLIYLYIVKYKLSKKISFYEKEYQWYRIFNKSKILYFLYPVLLILIILPVLFLSKAIIILFILFSLLSIEHIKNYLLIYKYILKNSNFFDFIFYFNIKTNNDILNNQENEKSRIRYLQLNKKSYFYIIFDLIFIIFIFFEINNIIYHFSNETYNYNTTSIEKDCD